MTGSTLTKCPTKAEVLVSRPSRIWCWIKTGKPSVRHNDGWNSLTLTYDHLADLIWQCDRRSVKFDWQNMSNADKIAFFNCRRRTLDALGTSLYVRCTMPLPNIMDNKGILLDCMLVGKYYKMPSHTMPPIVVSADSIGFTVIDGAHRLEAAHRRGDKFVAVFKPTWLSVNKIRF